MKKVYFTSGSLAEFLSSLRNDSIEPIEVVIQPGIHLTGPIELWSDFTLTLEEGAILRFDDDPNVYPPVWSRWEGVECYCMHPLIFANNSKRIVIRGKGEIDGNGFNWWEKFSVIEKEDRQTPKFDYELNLAKLNPDYANCKIKLDN